MKHAFRISMILLFVVYGLSLSAQERPWLTRFDEREELTHILKMSNGNYLLSGRTFEIGNKSDLAILVDNNGNELTRKPICPPCLSGNIVHTVETAGNELFHVRSTGDIFVSDSELNASRFVFNVKQTEFEFVETYQVLENANHIVVVSYAVKDNVRGLLHTTINTLTEGSIGIGLFKDIGVVDGYNSDDNGVSTGHLLRYDIQRNLLWSTDLDWGNITLDHVIVAWDQNIYAVGTIQDENQTDHWQGFMVAYDNEGNLLWEKRYDSNLLTEAGFSNPSKLVTKIKQIKVNEFALMGKESGRKSGKDKGYAFVLRVDGEGEPVEEFSSTEITEDVEAA